MAPPLSSDTPMVGGDSLDDIIRDNDEELLRRRSAAQSYQPQMDHQDGQDRRMSVMEFGAGDDAFGGYQFANDGMGSDYQDMAGNMSGNMTGSIAGNMTGNMTMSGQMANYSPQDVLDMSASADYPALSPTIMGSMMPASFSHMNMNQMAPGSSSMDLYSPTSVGPTHHQYGPGQINTMQNDYGIDMNLEDAPLSAAQSSRNDPLGMDDRDDSIMSVSQPFADSAAAHAGAQQHLSQGLGQFQQPGLQQPQMSHEASSASNFTSPGRSATQSTPQTAVASTDSPASRPPAGPVAPDSKKKTVYSKSGFDMMRALWLVATRKNAEIHLGAVDMSCAFVVCDVSLNDCPIIYVSDNFQNLTGYYRHEIVGKNCRFLQAPDGKVEAGTKREFVDGGAVYNLKQKIAEGKEVQQSLINYRKGGKPFLNLLTMIPIPWDTSEIRYFIGFQIDLVECPDAISQSQDANGLKVDYKHSDIGQYIWTPPASRHLDPESGQTLGVDDVSTLLQQFQPKGAVSDWHKQSWDKMLLENADDVVHVLSLKGLFLYLSPSCRRVLEYDAAELVGNQISSVCHPSDIVPVTRELKDTAAGNQVNIVFRIRRKNSGYTWFESHGSLFVEQGKGRKCIILVGRKRPVFTLSREDLEANGGIGDSDLWTKMSTSGMFLFVSSNIRSLLDLQPESLIGSSIQDMMRKESRPEFGRSIEKARQGKIVTCKHEVQNKRGQVLQAQTTLFPGDAPEGQKPTFLLAQTRLLKASSRAIAPATGSQGSGRTPAPMQADSAAGTSQTGGAEASEPKSTTLSTPSNSATATAAPASPQDIAMAAKDNIFDELRTTKCSSWQFELRQMEKVNRILAEELGGLLSNKKKRKRRKGVGNLVRDCANCHTRNTPEWRRGPSGQRDLCNSCGLRWAKQTGRVSPRNSSRGAGSANVDSQSKLSNSPVHSSPLHREMPGSDTPPTGIPDAEAAAGKQSNTAAQQAAPTTKPATSMPPPSQPLLEGGSGKEMTAIREERETSMP